MNVCIMVKLFIMCAFFQFLNIALYVYRRSESAYLLCSNNVLVTLNH